MNHLESRVRQAHVSVVRWLAILSGMAVAYCGAWAKAETRVAWDRFHGPNGTGVAHHVNFPSSWSVDDYLWRVELPGRGVSSPVVWRAEGTEFLYVQGGTPRGDARYIRCVDASSGETVWHQEQSFPAHAMHRRNSLGSSTCAVDASGVYVVFGAETYRITKYDHQGETVWHQDLGPFVCAHGGAISPVVIHDRVVCSLQQPVGESGLVATVLRSFDCASGKPGWHTVMTAHEKASFSAPCLRKVSADQSEIVCANTGDGLFAIDPDDGKPRWSLPVFKMRTVSSPVLAGDLVLGSTGSGGGGNYVVAVRPSERGDTATEVYRLTQQAPYVPTSVFRDGLLFLCSDKGIVTCLDAKTGEEHWKKRATGPTGASPVCVGERLVCVDEAGEVIVLAAAATYEKLGSGSLGENSQSTPAVGARRIYFRSDTHLMALGEKGAR